MRARSALPLIALPLIALVAIAVVLALFLGDRGRGTGPSVAAKPNSPPRDSSQLAPPTTEPQAPRNTRNESVSPAEPPSRSQAPNPPKEPETRTVRVLVLDVRGQAVPGVLLRWMNSKEVLDGTMTSDRTGEVLLQVEVGARSAELRAAPGAGEQPFATVRSVWVDANPTPTPPFLVVARAVSIRGHVIDAGGAPVPEMRISVGVMRSVEAALLPEFPYPLDSTSRITSEVRTDKGGAFDLGFVPAFPGSAIRTDARRFVPTVTEVPSTGNGNMLLHVVRFAAPATPTTSEVTGRVVHPDGTPATGASVQFGDVSGATAEDGSFRLEVPLKWARDEVGWLRYAPALAAGEPGYAPALLPGFAARMFPALPTAPAPVTLHLGQAHILAGHVIDSSEAPLSGWIVELVDPTILTNTEIPVPSAEGLGGPTKHITDAAGAFSFDGLLDRGYVIWARAGLAARSIRPSAPIPAGTTDVVLQAEENDTVDLVPGRVLFENGTPCAGIEVSIEQSLFAPGTANTVLVADSVRTDSQGGFELQDVPRERAVLSIGAPSIVSASFLIGGPEGLVLEPGHEVRLRAEARHHFSVTLETPEPGFYQLLVLDQDGESLPIHPPTQSGLSRFRWLIVPGQPSALFFVGDGARTLRIVRGGRAVFEEPITLDPAQPSAFHLSIP